MDTIKSVETRIFSEETRNTGKPLQACTVKLVEMGDVSVETKGVDRGLEIGLLPRNM